MSESKVIFYSLLSGDVYELPEDELDNLDDFQIPLSKKPNSSCKKCYGRGYLGFDIHKKYYPMCRCVVKNIDRDRVKDVKIKY